MERHTGLGRPPELLPHLASATNRQIAGQRKAICRRIAVHDQKARVPDILLEPPYVKLALGHVIPPRRHCHLDINIRYLCRKRLLDPAERVLQTSCNLRCFRERVHGEGYLRAI